MTRRIDFRFVYLAVTVLYARMRDTASRGNAKGSLSRRLRAGKNTRRVYAVKKHDGARSAWKLYEANRC